MMMRVRVSRRWAVAMALAAGALFLMLGSFVVRPDTAALLMAFGGAWTFVVLYLNEWRHVERSPEAKHLIGFTLVLALILTEELGRRFFLGVSGPVDNWRALDGHQWFVTVTATAAGFYLWQRVYMLAIHQVLPRRRDRRQEADRATVRH